ncbi:MAG: hypothetical protein JW764_00960 [Chlorobiaceae bacterium]|nr:hypothetical protein [Chlorobiaceae bacterium]
MSARCNSLVVAALLALATPGTASAALRPADVTVSAEPDSLFAGERLRYVITVRHRGTEALSIASLATGQNTPFEIIASRSNTKKLDDGLVEYRMDAELAVFGQGRQRLPGFTVLAGDGNRLDVRPAETVTVLSATDAAVTELRPVSPPASAPFPAWLLVPALLVLAVLLLAGYFARTFFLTLRRHLDDPVRAARKKLRAIRRQLSKGLAPAAGYEALSNILREFLQNRYGFGAREMVTQEIAEELAARNINIRAELITLLDQADLVKFADRRPDHEECRASLNIAEELVASAGEGEMEVVGQ